MKGPAEARWAWRLAAGGVALVGAVLLWPRLALLLVPFQHDYNEGWNTYRATLVQAGGQVYAALPQWWVTNYPPLSFHAAAGLGGLVGDALLAGRLLSLLGLLATSLGVAAIVRHLTGHGAAALYAGLLVPAWIGLYAPGYIAMNDPQLLAMGFVTFGLYAYLRAGAWLVVSALGFAIGLFIKHNLVDLPLAVALHLVLSRRWRDLLVWAGTAAMAGLALLEWSPARDGPHMLAHVLIARDYLPAKGLRMSTEFGATIIGALALTAHWGPRQRFATSRGLLVLALAACLALGVALAPGAGVDRNGFFNALVALAMMVGVALHDMLAAPGRNRLVLAALLLALPLLPALAQLPDRASHTADALREAGRRTREFQAGVRLLAGLRAPALCENMQLCVAAGQTLDYDPFFVDDRMRRGLVAPETVVTMLEARRWGAIVLDRRPVDRLLPGTARERFAAPVVDAILANYRVAFEASSFVILVPDG